MQAVAHQNNPAAQFGIQRVAADDLFGKRPVWFSMVAKLIRFVAINSSILPDIPMKGALFYVWWSSLL